MKKIKELIENNMQTIIGIIVVILIIISIYFIATYPVLSNTLNKTEEKRLKELTQKQHINPMPLLFYVVLIALGFFIFFSRIGCILCADCEQAIIPWIGIGVIILAIFLAFTGGIK